MEGRANGWTLRVVKAAPGTLVRGKQVLGVIDEAAREVVYMCDTDAPESVWMEALGQAMTALVADWVYVGDVRRSDLRAVV